MSVIHMEAVGQETIDRASKLLAGINGGVERAVRSAMSRTVSHLRTQSEEAIRERYAISVAALRTEQNIRVRYSYRDGVQAAVSFAGHKIPLYRYDGAAPTQPAQNTGEWVSAKKGGKWLKVHPGMAASGHQFRETSPRQFPEAFTARMESGHIGIFERTGGVTSTGNDGLRELMGSSIPQMLGSEAVSKQLVERSMEQFREQLDGEVLRVLNGWGR